MHLRGCGGGGAGTLTTLAYTERLSPTAPQPLSPTPNSLIGAHEDIHWVQCPIQEPLSGFMDLHHACGVLGRRGEEKGGKGWRG